MSYDDLIQTPLWNRFSKKMVEKILQPRNGGYFTKEDAESRSMQCIKGKGGFIDDGNSVITYWLVDPTDGIIVDAKFQVFGPSFMIAACETACELVIGKNYDQAKRISAELIDMKLRDKQDIPAFPEETLYHLNLVLEAIEEATENCVGIPLGVTYVSPVPEQIEGQTLYPEWTSYSHAQKLAIIEKVLAEDVRPYVELDSGGIEVQELVDNEVIITYQGACTSCFSAIGATLSTIQSIIQTKIHPALTVTPNMDNLHL